MPPSNSFSYAADPTKGNELSVPDLRLIIQETGRRGSVSMLNLTGNRFSGGSLTLLTGYLRGSSNVAELNLSMCSLGDRGAIEIIRAICNATPRGRTVTRLRKLDLSMNNITPDGAQKIAALLVQANNVSLSDLTLKFNPISTAGVLALCRMRVPLRVLDCRYCRLDLSEEGFAKLCHAIRETRTIEELFLDGNGITPEQGSVLVDGLKSVRKTKLIPESIYLTECAGPLSALESYWDDGELESPLPQDVVEDCAKVDGQVTVVRGEVRGRAKPLHEFGRSKSSTRVEPVEIRRRAVSSRSASQYARSVSRAAHLDPHKCAPVPILRRKNTEAEKTSKSDTESEEKKKEDGDAAPAEKPQDAEKSESTTNDETEATTNNDTNGTTEDSKEKESDKEQPESESSEPAENKNPEEEEEEPIVVEPVEPASTYVAPEPSQLVKSQIGASKWFDLVKHENDPAIAHHNGLLLTKGKQARMLLDRCVANDAQCKEILSLTSLEELGADRGAELNIPDALLMYDARPSSLEAMEQASDIRIGGLAKLLAAVMRAPGDRVAIDRLRDMDELPTALLASGAEGSAAHYRSLRNLENNQARMMLTKITRTAQQNDSTVSRSSSAYRRRNSSSKPRYLDHFSRSASKSSRAPEESSK